MDLNSLLLMLNGLGPWGILIGAVLTIGVQWLRNRNPQPAPAPIDPNSPTPTPEPSKTPLLDALLSLLKLTLLKKATTAPAKFEAVAEATTDDIDHETVDKWLKVISELKK